MMYTVEYAKSGRAGCKACGGKIAKAELRIGKNVMLDIGRFGPEWYHYNCFWLLNPSTAWTCFAGTSLLRLEDQQSLHLKATGRAMSQQMVEMASAKISQRTAVQEKAEEEASAASAAFTRSSPSTILSTFLQKHLDLLKVPELKAACKEHGLKLPAKAKRADIVKLIMEQEIEKVSGLAYHGVKKNCTIPQLKEILKNSGLAVSGTKEDLIARLMESQGATTPDLPLKYASQATPKKKEKWGGVGDYYFSGHDLYKKDEEDSRLVEVAKSGTLAGLEAELAKLPRQDEAKRAAKLNHARRWTEVEVKGFYDKSWEWFGDTAITAAARRGKVEMVAALLKAGADPTLTACPRDDVTEDAFKAAQRSEDTSKLLMIAKKYWTRASYAGVSYSDERSKGFARNPNKPADQAKLNEEIEAFEKQHKELKVKKMKEAEDSRLMQLAKSGTLARLVVELDRLPKQDKTAKLNQAARRGEVKMVAGLLMAGADPTRTLWVAQSQTKNAQEAVKEAEDAGVGSDSLKMSCVVDRCERAKSTLELMSIASKHWSKESQADISLADENSNIGIGQANLKQEIEAAFKAKYQEQQLKNCSEDLKRTRPNVVVQMKESGSLEPASKKTKCEEIAVDCLGKQCTNPPAQKCPHKRCQKCCPGPCSRHKK